MGSDELAHSNQKKLFARGPLGQVRITSADPLANVWDGCNETQLFNAAFETNVCYLTSTVRSHVWMIELKTPKS